MPPKRTPALCTLSLLGAALFLLSACGGGAADVVNTADDSGSTGSGSTGSGSGSGGTGGSGGTVGTGGSGGTGGGGTTTTPPAPGTDVVTYKNDIARTGQNLTETTLTLTNVAAATFGLLRKLSVDGKVDAQPLYLSDLTVAGAVHNAVYVATESDSVYAFDSDTGTTLWHVSLLPSGETTSDTHGCGQVTPAIGVTSTPVIDRTAGTNGAIYVVAMSKDSTSAYHQRLHALDVTTGAELFNGPVAITATYTAPGSVVATFEPGQYEERAALLLSQGIVYTSFTSHCDAAPYSGWMMGYSETTLAQTSVLNIGPNSNAGPAIWMAGGGPGADSSGNIYLLSANGAFETTLDANGFPNKQDYGNSFLKLAATSTTLTVADYFTMSNEVAESNADQDLGSGGELILPDQTDSTNTVRHLVVGAGKDGNIYLVNRDSMGKFNASSNNIWQQLSGALPGGIWSTPAYFNGTLYYGDNGATLKAFALSNAKLGSSPASQSPSQFAYPGTAPAVSANGTSNGIVWAHENSSSQAVLHAYDATNLAHELYNSSQAANNRDQFGPGNKFITPTVADGKVFVGTQNSVAVFGLLQ
jgi:outer membrane protein assembly factor BamB